MNYAFKDAARFRPGFDREAGAARLAHILDRKGRLDSDDIIRDAASAKSPLHPAFTWDAGEALERIHQVEADYLRRNFVTVTIEPNGREEVRAVVPVTIVDDERRVYISTQEALREPAYRLQVLQQAKSELRAFQRKYSALSELAAVFAAIDALDASERKAA